MRRAAGTVVLLCCLLVLAPSASAIYEPIGGGVTRLTLDARFVSGLDKHGIELEARESAKISGRTVSFPVSGGRFDPTTGQGSVNHDGALVLRAGKRSVRLRSLMLKTTRRSTPFSARVGGGQLKLAAAAALHVSREGFGNLVKVRALKLSDKVVSRLEKRLGIRGVLAPGQSLGSAVTRAAPSEIAVRGGTKATLTFDPALVQKLDRLFVAINPVFPAEHEGPVFTLPLESGTVAVDGHGGKLKLGGSIEFLQLGSGQVFWEDPWLDLGASVGLAEANIQPSPPYGGRLPRGPVWGFDPATLSIEAKEAQRSVAVAVPLVLDAAMAAHFNEVFAGGAAEFSPGEVVGQLTNLARGQ